MPPKKATTEPTRKSTRAVAPVVVEKLQAAPKPAKKAAPGKADASKKKAATRVYAEDDEEDEDEDEEDDEPAYKPSAAKKAKTGSSNAAPAAASAGKTAVGSIVKDVTLMNENDEPVTLLDLVKETGIIIFTYPKANTPGCTTQACGFRDIHDDIKAAGYSVYGLSTDKPKAQLSWKTGKSLTYSLLSDPDSLLLNQLGATAAKRRCHFVIEKGGKLLEAALGVKPKDDPQNALAFVVALK